MTNKQHPIGTGFTAASTAADVLQGINLRGHNVIITAGHSGIGQETTRAGRCGRLGARRRAQSGGAAAALADIDHVETDRLDLADPASVDAFVARYRASGRALHILINNAGVMASGPLVLDGRGYEQQFATNHLGHFQLIQGLVPALRAANGAHVVAVSSRAHRQSDIRWDDPHFAHDYDPMVAYRQSKTAIMLSPSNSTGAWPATASAPARCIPAGSSAPALPHG